MGNHTHLCINGFWSLARVIRHRGSYEKPTWHLPYLENILLWLTCKTSCQVHRSKRKKGRSWASFGPCPLVIKVPVQLPICPQQLLRKKQYHLLVHRLQDAQRGNSNSSLTESSIFTLYSSLQVLAILLNRNSLHSAHTKLTQKWGSKALEVGIAKRWPLFPPACQHCKEQYICLHGSETLQWFNFK